MKKNLIVLSILIAGALESFAQEFKIITVVESIVPMGVGRSRIIENQSDVDSNRFTTDRSQGTESRQSNIKRSDLKVNEFTETKLLNFYSGTGINFQNIASNDAIIASKVNNMIDDGWKLAFISSGVESDAGDTDGHGLFITRLYFSRH